MKLLSLATALTISLSISAQSSDCNCNRCQILKTVGYQFNALRLGDITLPKDINGTPITWSIQPDASASDYMSYTSGVISVTSLPKGEYRQAGTITASAGNETFVYPLTLAPDDEMYGYLYCHMAGTSENTLYAIGTKADGGVKYHPVINNQPIYDPEELAKVEGGVRDAFITRSYDGKEYLMVTTDMSNRKSRTWWNHGINLMKSNDLIHWTSTTFDFRKGPEIFSDSLSKNIYKDFSLINRVWAPQVSWDKDYEWKDKDGKVIDKGGYFVYYSMLSTNEGDDHDRMYYSYANKDFTTLTKPQLFHDRGIAMIDCHIDWNDCDQQYHIFFKREGADARDRGIYKAVFDKLPGASSSSFTGSFGQWKDILHITNEGTNLTEGPSAFRLINENKWKVAYIRYSGGKAYKICNANSILEDIDKGQVIEGDVNPQHGSFITLTEDEYNLLEAWTALKAQADALASDPKTAKGSKLKAIKAKLQKTYTEDAVKQLLKLYK